MNINNILENYDLDKDKDYKKIEEKINYLLEQLEFVDDEDEREKINSKILEIKELLKKDKQKTRTKYPDYTNKKFVQKLLSKKEFAMNKINNEDVSNIQTNFLN